MPSLAAVDASMPVERETLARTTSLGFDDWLRHVKSAHGCARPVCLRGRTLRVHDLRHTAASIWLAYGADPKVVQPVLGHATATMTMDLYGHLLDASLWLPADKIGDILGTFFERSSEDADASGEQ